MRLPEDTDKTKGSLRADIDNRRDTGCQLAGTGMLAAAELPAVAATGLLEAAATELLEVAAGWKAQVTAADCMAMAEANRD